jgi:hypothetical protein
MQPVVLLLIFPGRNGSNPNGSTLGPGGVADSNACSGNYPVWLLHVDRKFPREEPVVGAGVANRNVAPGKIVAVSQQNRVRIGTKIFKKIFSARSSLYCGKTGFGSGIHFFKNYFFAKPQTTLETASILAI